MDHVQMIDTGKLTNQQKHIFRKWAELLNSTNNIILLYWTDSNSTEYDEIYDRLVKKNKYITLSKVRVHNIEHYKFLDVNNVPAFTIYQKRKKLAHISGKGITEAVLQKYLDNMLFHKEALGIKI